MPAQHNPSGGTGNRALLVRHGETEWSRSGKHTGRTDVPLTDVGRADAAALMGCVPVGQPALVLTSPLRRAADTARLAGLTEAEPDDDLMEWDYGDVEGRTTPEMRVDHPGWTVWDGRITGGESLAEVASRVDRVIARCRAAGGDSVLFSHGHLLRVLAARWLGMAPDAGRFLLLDAAHWSVLGWNRETPALATWNIGIPPPS